MYRKQNAPYATPGKTGGALAFLLRQLLLLACAITIVACQEAPTPPPAPFPAADAVPGWTPTGETQVYDSDNLFDLVNGQAEVFFVYGFEQTAVQQYQNSDETIISVEVWQTTTPADAYGLFTAYVAGSPSDIGNDSDSDPGRRLVFWQNRYYVRVRARQPVDDADLRRFAEAVASALPAGGERPSVVNSLPSEHLVERSQIFFHEEIAIQSRLWLGGTNLLDLSPETNGALGLYNLGDTISVLMIVEYPDQASASNGLAGLVATDLEELVAADVRDNVLAAMFGQVDEDIAADLVAQALTAE